MRQIIPFGAVTGGDDGWRMAAGLARFAGSRIVQMGLDNDLRAVRVRALDAWTAERQEDSVLRAR